MTAVFTTLLSLLKSTGFVSNFAISNLSTLLFKLPKLLGIFLNLSLSNLTTSDYKLVKSVFLAKETPVPFPKSAFVA